AVLGSHVNLQLVAHAHNQIAKPGKRLWRQQLPPARQHDQTVKLLQQQFRPTLFVSQAFPLRAPDLPPNAISVESPEEVLDTRMQVQPVKAECFGFAQVGRKSKVGLNWPQLDVL